VIEKVITKKPQPQPVKVVLDFKKGKPTERFPTATNIKKDALWKPLLRQFRRFVKRLSQSNINRSCHASFVYDAGSLIEDDSDFDKSEIC
jgi:hypothetical protein